MPNISDRTRFEKLRRQLDEAVHLLKKGLNSISDWYYDSMPDDIKDVFKGIYHQTHSVSTTSDELWKLFFELGKSNKFRKNVLAEKYERQQRKRNHKMDEKQGETRSIREKSPPLYSSQDDIFNQGKVTPHFECNKLSKSVV